MASCVNCPLRGDCLTGPLTGRWVGHSDGLPIIMVVGEAPTLTDDQKHKTFTGARGHLVHDVIMSIAPNAKVFYTNLLQCRAVDGNDVNDQVVSNCMELANFPQVVDEVNPVVIIALGNTVLKSLTGKSGITKYRGEELDYNGYLVIPTFSPGAVLRSPKYSTSFKTDITKATLSANGNSSKFKYNYIPVMNKDAVRDMIKDLTVLKANNKISYMSLDFETTTFDYWRPETHILTMGICADGKTCYGIPMEHPRSPWRGQSAVLMKLLSPFICSDIPVGGNNWKYDQKWARAKLHRNINFVQDNMLMSYANDENSPHGLKYQADMYCGSGHYDSDITWPSEFDPVRDDVNQKVAEYDSMDLTKMLKYNALDAFYSWNVYPFEKERLDNDPRVGRIYKYLLEQGSHMFVRIEEQGMWIDPDRLKEATDTCIKNLTEVKSKLDSLIPDGWIESNLSGRQQKEGFNWNSTKQLGMLFFQEDGFNFPILVRTGKGAPSTSESTIISLSTDIDHPVLNGLLEYRKWSKYMNTYLLPWKAKTDKDSRLHPNFKLHGTVTGRLSGEDGVHQVPRDNFIRRLIGAPPGWSFLEIDGSQIELRCVAAIAHESTMLRIYSTGGDIHRTTAAQVAGKKPEDITSAERKKAKAVNFGFVYGMGWKKFKVYAWEKYGVRLTDDEAKLFRKRFFELYHDLPDWHNRMKKIVRQLGYVVSPIGRKRRLPDIYSTDEGVQAGAEREAINSPVQGFGSDYVLAAFISMFLIIMKEDPNFETIRPVGSVHDAQYYEIRNDKVNYWAPIIKKNFDDPTRLKEWFDYVPPLPITGDCKIGNHWGDAKDWDIGQPFPHEMR
jgi:uracil-DNA glycosylase family 4